MKCPKCQTINPASAKFCMECGLDLVMIVEASPIDYSQPQSYTPKFLIEKILTTKSAIEGEHKFVTVLFADVAGFTSMSEKLNPEQVHQVMDGCFKVLMEQIHQYVKINIISPVFPHLMLKLPPQVTEALYAEISHMAVILI